MTTAADRPQHRLPPETYLDPGWYEREQRLLVGRTWAYVAHVGARAGVRRVARRRPERCGPYPWDDLVEVHRERWPLACIADVHAAVLRFVGDPDADTA